MERYIVIGLGNFGAQVARTLQTEGQEVLCIDIDETQVNEIGQSVSRAVCADGTKKEVLEKLGASNARAAVVSTGENMAASVLAVLALREIGVKEVYVKVSTAQHIPVFRALSVTEVILPEHVEAERLAHRISSWALLQYVRLGDDVAVQDMTVPIAWCGKSLRDLDLPRKHGLQVVAIRDGRSGKVVSPPNPDTVLESEDTLIVGGKVKALDRAANQR